MLAPGMRGEPRHPSRVAVRTSFKRRQPLIIQLAIFMIPFLQIAMERGQQIPGIVVQLLCRNIPFPLFVVCSSISSPFVPPGLEPQRPPARRTRIIARAPRQILAAKLPRRAHFLVRA